jgi:hypothetical protein
MKYPEIDAISCELKHISARVAALEKLLDRKASLREAARKGGEEPSSPKFTG